MEFHFHYLSPDRSLFLSDGCQHLMKSRDCEWFFNHILTYNLLLELKKLYLQVWNFKRIDETTGLIWCSDFDGNLLYGSSLNEKEIRVDEITIWLTGDIALLPTEY